MSRQKKNIQLLPGIRIDKSMDKYEGQVIFKEKVERAKKMIEKYGMPKEYYEAMEKQKKRTAITSPKKKRTKAK